MATTTNAFIGTPHKVTAHLTQNEPLSFEKSSPGKKGYKLAPLDVPEVDARRFSERRRAMTNLLYRS